MASPRVYQNNVDARASHRDHPLLGTLGQNNIDARVRLKVMPVTSALDGKALHAFHEVTLQEQEQQDAGGD